MVPISQVQGTRKKPAISVWDVGPKNVERTFRTRNVKNRLLFGSSIEKIMVTRLKQRFLRFREWIVSKGWTAPGWILQTHAGHGHRVLEFQGWWTCSSSNISPCCNSQPTSEAAPTQPATRGPTREAPSATGSLTPPSPSPLSRQGTTFGSKGPANDLRFWGLGHLGGEQAYLGDLLSMVHGY